MENFDCHFQRGVAHSQGGHCEAKWIQAPHANVAHKEVVCEKGRLQSAQAISHHTTD